MGDAWLERLRSECEGEVLGQVALADLTTLGVGGPARILVTAESDDDLAAVGRAVTETGLPWLAVGRGSNLLVPDRGWPGIVVQLGRGFRGLEVEGNRVHAGAAEPLPSLAVRVARAGLGGWAWACAVPGSLGGAVRMNAGAHGGDMARSLVEVEVFRLRTGVREVWPVEALGLRYRDSELPDDGIVVAATMQLDPADPDEVQAEIDEIRSWRRAHQPIREPNCGSVFTNPPGDSAGRLIDAVGGKELVEGGARVSETHANFIVTRPGATAADVLRLIRRIQDLVLRETGVELHTEVQMRGAFDEET